METKLNQFRKKENEIRDEFYTRYTDVEAELRHYPDSFRDKRVYLPCDDPFHSQFFKYFVLNFDRLGLASLTTTAYKRDWKEQEQRMLDGFFKDDGKPRRGFGTDWLCKIYSVPKDISWKRGFVDELVGYGHNRLRQLSQGGDFRSPECLMEIRSADVIVTNPPFSLLTEFIDTLIGFNKEFLVMGNLNALASTKLFRHVCENRLWVGHGFNAKKLFTVPEDYPTNTERRDAEGRKQVEVQAVTWFTNLENERRHVPLDLSAVYRGNEDSYSRYDYFDAIEVGEWKDIPKDYAGLMGVPVTFLKAYDPDQFEVLGLDSMVVPREGLSSGRLTLGGKRKYIRVIIRNRHPESLSSLQGQKDQTGQKGQMEM